MLKTCSGNSLKNWISPKEKKKRGSSINCKRYELSLFYGCIKKLITTQAERKKN